MPRKPKPDWERIARKTMHPEKVQIIETLATGETSPRQFSTQSVSGMSLSGIAYHFRQLADDGVIVESRTAMKRGAVEHFYTLA